MTIPLSTPTHASLLRCADVIARTSVSKSAIYAMSADGTFPKPTKTGRVRGFRWIDREVDEWIRDRMANRPS